MPTDLLPGYLTHRHRIAVHAFQVPRREDFDDQAGFLKAGDDLGLMVFGRMARDGTTKTWVMELVNARLGRVDYAREGDWVVCEPKLPAPAAELVIYVVPATEFADRFEEI